VEPHRLERGVERSGEESIGQFLEFESFLLPVLLLKCCYPDWPVAVVNREPLGSSTNVWEQ
jgi:hypothetical protein